MGMAYAILVASMLCARRVLAVCSAGEPVALDAGILRLGLPDRYCSRARSFEAAPLEIPSNAPPLRHVELQIVLGDVEAATSPAWTRGENRRARDGDDESVDASVAGGGASGVMI